MIWIELLGPSGVGKSYWYQKFIEKYPEYEINGLVLNRIRYSLAYKDRPFYIKIFFFLYRLGIPKLKTFARQILLDYYSRNFEKKDKNLYTEADEKIIKTYLEAVQQANEPYIILLKKIEYFASQLRKFKFYGFYLKEDDIYLAEDGLQHLSPVYFKDLQTDAYLVLEKNLSSIIDQRLHRAKNKPSTFTEFLLSPEDLKANIEYYFIQYQKKIETIEQNQKEDIILKIDTEKGDVIKIIFEKIQQVKNKGRKSVNI